MREDPQNQRPSQPDGQSSSSFSGLSFSKIEGYAARQLHRLEALGAKFAEKLSTPVIIRNPSPGPTKTAIIITRWLGAGLFGVVFPFQNGEVTSGWIPIHTAMEANPGLAPSGTFPSDRWDRDILTCRDHLIPKHETITRRVLEAAREVVRELLQEFPHRFDLSLDFRSDTKKQSQLAEIFKPILQPLTKEIRDGVKVASLSHPDEGELQGLLARFVDAQMEEMTVLHALKLFRETRVRAALAQYESGERSGIIHELIEQTENVCAKELTPHLATAMRKNLFEKIAHRDVQHSVGIGLAISLTTRPEFIELWKQLSMEERGTIVSDISQRALRKAASDYVLSN